MDRWHSFLAAVCIALVALSAAGVASGAPANGTPTTTTAGTASNTTTANNTTAGGGSGGGGGGFSLPDVGVGDFVPDMGLDIDPWKFFTGIVLGVVGSLARGVADLIDIFNEFIFGIPAPGERDDPSTWTDPQNGNWPGVWVMYWLWASLGVVALAIGGMLTFSDGDRRQQRRMQRGLLKAFVLIIAGFPIVAFALHLGDALALALAPSGDEFVSTPGKIKQLGLGLIVGAIILIVNATVVGAAILIVLAQHISFLFLAAFWPFFISLRAMPIGTLRTVGNIGISAFVALILIKVIQTAILRFLFTLSWGVNDGGALVAGLLGTMVGLVIAFIALPYIGFKKVVPGAAMVMGGRVMTDGGSLADRARGAKSRAGDVRDRYQQARGGMAAARNRVTGSRGGGGSPSDSGGGSQSTTSRGSTAGFTRARQGTGMQPASHAERRRAAAQSRQAQRDSHLNSDDAETDTTDDSQRQS